MAECSGTPLVDAYHDRLVYVTEAGEIVSTSLTGKESEVIYTAPEDSELELELVNCDAQRVLLLQTHYSGDYNYDDATLYSIEYESNTLTELVTVDEEKRISGFKLIENRCYYVEYTCAKEKISG